MPVRPLKGFERVQLIHHGRPRAFKVEVLTPLSKAARALLEHPENEGLLERIVQGVVSTTTGGVPTSREGYAVDAGFVPVHVVKPFSKEPPKHVYPDSVWVQPHKIDRYGDFRAGFAERASLVEDYWSRSKELAEKGVEPLRFTLPLALVSTVETDQQLARNQGLWTPSMGHHEYMVFIRSKLPSVFERIQELERQNKFAQAHELATRFREHVDKMRQVHKIRVFALHTDDLHRAFFVRERGTGTPTFVFNPFYKRVNVSQVFV